MIVCSICVQSDWCDGGDTCDCRCHDNFEGFSDDVEDDQDDGNFDYDED